MPAADPGFDCCHDSGGHARDCEVIARAEKAEARVVVLESALRCIERDTVSANGARAMYAATMATIHATLGLPEKP